MSAAKKNKAATVRQQVFSGVAFNQYRLLVRAEKSHDDRLLNLTIGLGFLAGNLRAKEVSAVRTVLQRIAAHALGWAELISGREELAAVQAERERQEKLLKAGKFLFTCASRVADPIRKLRVLVVEVGEVAQEIDNLENNPGYEGIRENLKTELIQVAAEAVAWLESMEGK